MEIIRRAKTEFKFKVIRPFRKAGRTVQVGEEVDISETDQLGFVQRGRVVPCDLPAVGVYIALRPFCLPGRIEKFECEAMELVSVKAEDALPLMLQGAIIPRDDRRWRPNNRRLSTKTDCSRRMADEKSRGIFEGQLFEAGIHPNQKRK